MRTRRALLDSATKALLRAANELGFPLRARLESELLLSFVLGVERIELHSHPEREVSEAEAGAFQSCIARRAKGEPIEYITKRASFYGRDFYVDSRVLIPRAESELLVDEARALIEAYGLRSIAEVGVGSGAVIGTLARFYPQCEFIGTDVSAEALAVARKNVGDVTLLHCSLLNFNSSLGNHSHNAKALLHCGARSSAPQSQGEAIVQSNTANTRIVCGEIQDSKANSESSLTDFKEVSESTLSDSHSPSCHSEAIAEESTNHASRDISGYRPQYDKVLESYPHANLESKADSEPTPAVGQCPTAIESSFSSERSSEQALKASSGRGDCQGGRERLRNSSPSPLDEKKKESKEVKKILEVKAKDSEKVDCHTDKSARNDDRLDSQSIDCHDFAPAESRNEDKTESSTMFAPQIQLIISNPPYIARDYPISAPLRYEPAIALFSGEDGLDMLRELIVEASRRGVWLLCEIGYDQRECLEQILEQSGAKEWRFYKDLSGFWRGFVARF